MILSSSKKTYLIEILGLLGDGKKEIPKLLLLFLVGSIFDLAGLGLIGPYIAIITNPDSMSEIIKSANLSILTDKTTAEIIVAFSVALFFIFILKAIASTWINYVIVRFSATQQVVLRRRLMKVYQSLPYTDYIQRNSSEYIHNTQTLVSQYSNSILTGGMRATSDLIVAIVLLIFLAISSWLSFVILIVLLVLVIIIYDLLFRRRIRDIGLRSNIAANKMVKGIHEGIEGLKEVRVLGKENYFYTQVSQGAEEYGRSHAQSITLGNIPRYLFETVLITFIISLVLISIYKGDGLETLLPVLGVFGLASIRLLPAASIISTAIVQFRFSRDAVRILWKDIHSNQETCQTKKAIDTVALAPFSNLEVSGLCYAYPGAETKSITELSLQINRGEAIGIIGSSGSGKTTLVDVLLGLLVPVGGYVNFNNKNIFDNIDAWRSHIAYLPQEIFITDASLRENVALGIDANDIDEGQLQKAIKMASLATLVNELPDGLDTILGENGIRFSGGQRQRVALARAFYHERDVIIMDESTSALDSETEREIVREIQQLKGKKTSIIIAHRLTTVQHCDRIYRLDRGRIVESGTPKSVLG